MHTPCKASLEHEKLFLNHQNPHLRDIRLAIEFKHLVGHAPGGVYLFPHQSDIRQLFGVAFLRKGLYRGGIFRFKITLPSDYNCSGSYPCVIFTPPIFHPLVDPTSGELHLQSSDLFREWDPKKHFLITVLIFLKKIFYLKSFDDLHNLPNEEALHLFTDAREEFLSRVKECVDDAAMNLNRMPAECPLVFTEPRAAHKALRDQIFGASAAQREARRRAVAVAPHIGFLSPETPAAGRDSQARLVGCGQGQNLSSDFSDEPQTTTLDSDAAMLR